jgi:hypothetical protein
MTEPSSRIPRGAAFCIDQLVVYVMNEKLILDYVRLPARLDSQQTAQLLGFASRDIPILLSAKLLNALGSPAANAPKYFAAAEVEKLTRDNVWLGKATRAITKYWRGRNGNRKQTCVQVF